MSRKKRWFSLEKYRRYAFVWAGLFLALLALALLMGLGRDMETEFAVKIGLTLGLMMGSPFLIASVYSIVTYFKFQKKAKEYTPTVGVISNWSVHFRRYGSVAVKEGEKEYDSAIYFLRTTAKEMVGKKISYAVIDETLFIYEVLE